MKTFDRWQPVEVRGGVHWGRAAYLYPNGEREHRVYCDEWGERDYDDDCIRPVPWLEATGDDLEIVEAALGQHYHHHVQLDLQMHGKITDRTLRVRQLHEAAKAAMEAGR